MKKYFFDNTFEAVVYLIFISLVPMSSIIMQYILNDRTMYVSCLVAGFAMTYDYIILFKKNIEKRLWIEAIAASIILIVSVIFSVVRLIYNLMSSVEALSYSSLDLIIVLVLAGMLLINIIEIIFYAKHDYKKRYLSRNDFNFTQFTEGMKLI